MDAVKRMLEIYHNLIREIEREKGQKEIESENGQGDQKKKRQGKERVKDRGWMPLKGCLRYIII